MGSLNAIHLILILITLELYMLIYIRILCITITMVALNIHWRVTIVCLFYNMLQNMSKYMLSFILQNECVRMFYCVRWKSLCPMPRYIFSNVLLHWDVMFCFSVSHSLHLYISRHSRWMYKHYWHMSNIITIMSAYKYKHLDINIWYFVLYIVFDLQHMHCTCQLYAYTITVRLAVTVFVFTITLFII